MVDSLSVQRNPAGDGNPAEAAAALRTQTVYGSGRAGQDEAVAVEAVRPDDASL